MANTTKTVRYDLTASDHLSGPMGQAARALDKASASMDITERTSRTLERALQTQAKAAQASADGALALSRADTILAEAASHVSDEALKEDEALRRLGATEAEVAARALEADAALRREADAAKEAGRQAELAAAKQQALSDSFDKVAKNAGGFDLKGAGIALSPALLPLAGGIAAGIGAIGVSFGAAALGAGLFGKAASSVLSTANQNATKLQALEQKLNTATTAAQKKAVQDQINTLEAGWSKGYMQLLGNLEGFKQAWTETSQAIAVPALTTMISALTDSLGFLQTAATPVAKVFQTWGSELDQYFSSAKGSAEINRIAAAFGKFSASQLQAIGVFIVDIGKGVFSLGQYVAGLNVNFGTFGQHLDEWGAAFARWAQSSAARQDVDNFLAYLHANGPAVADLLKNLGGALAVFAPGLSSVGSLELKLVTDFLGVLAKTPKFIAQPLIDTAGALLLLQKTGLLSVGIKVVGAAAKWLSGGVIDFGSGAAAGAEIRAAMVSGGAAAAAEIRAAMAGGGAVASAEGAAGGAAGAGRVAVTGAGASLAAMLAPVVAGALGGLIIAEWTNQFRTAANQHPAPAGQQGARSYGAPPAADINAWKQYDQAVSSATKSENIERTAAQQVVADFTRQQQGAVAANGALANYTAAVQKNGVTSTQANGARIQLLNDLQRAGVNALTAQTDVGNYSAAILYNGVQSTQAGAARRQLITDILNAGTNAQHGYTDMQNFTTAVQTHSATSDAVRSARQRLITDLTNAGLSAKDATTLVNGLQTSVKGLTGKAITIEAIARGQGAVSVTASGLAAKEIALSSKMAQGGLVRMGSGPVADDVPAMLSRGELVVPAAMVRSGVVDHLRGMLPGFASGGLAGGISAFPGAVGGPYGGDHRDIVADDLTKEIQAMIAAIKAAQAAQAGAVSASGARTGSVAVEQAYAFSLFPRYGWGADQKAPLIALWNQESGWNPYAVNPNGGAYGIPQSLGHGHPYNLGDYQAQIQWGENYIKATYGTPANAWGGYWARGGWYDNGGLLMPGATLAYNGTGKPEHVTTSDDMAALIGEVRALRGELRQLTGVAAAIPARTGQHVAGAVGGAGADAAFRRRYPGR